MKEKVRHRFLPAGWYPQGEKETRELLEEWRASTTGDREETGAGVAAIVPHAGWHFSGKLAFRSILELQKDCDTVVVVGGHMHGGEGIRAAAEEGYETPFGVLKADRELISKIGEELRESGHELEVDAVPDNTVEVNLPFVRYLFPESRAVWLRVGAGEEASALGEACARAGESLERKICLIGSTDLTHYGPSFGFSPAGVGEEAYRWVKEENDAAIVEAMRDMDIREVLRLGREQKAACSAGAAAAAIRFAESMGSSGGRVIAYSSSYEIHPGDSFVGYAGIVYPQLES